MTGIERLRAIAGAWDEWGLGGTLAEIADEIERDFADARMGHVSLMRILEVTCDMERHCLGHEGMEDSPVARWARELRGALKSYTSDGRDTQNPSCADPDGAADVTSEAQKVTRDPAEDVSMSAYDLLPADERDAIAWVREHGGLDYVKREWRSRVPHERYEAMRQRLLGHIAECETALGRRNQRIEELTHRVSDLTRENAELRKRAMPEGMCWPVFEDGESLRFGDVVNDVEVRSVVFRDGGILLSDCTSVPGWGTWRSYKEPIKRPAPKVLDVDGVDTSVGDTVYDVDTGEKMWVCALPEQGAYQCVKLRLANGMFKTLDPFRFTHRAIRLAADGKPLREGETVWDANGDELVIGALEDGGHTVTCRYVDVGDGIPVHGMWSPSDLTHQRPVLDADGVPIKKGDTVWEVGTVLAIHMTVVEVSRDTVRCEYAWTDGKVYRPCCSPETLTHTKPEIDSWQRIEEDAGCTATKYNERRGTIFTTKQQVARDLVRRCRALAERERGE